MAVLPSSVRCCAAVAMNIELAFINKTTQHIACVKPGHLCSMAPLCGSLQVVDGLT